MTSSASICLFSSTIGQMIYALSLIHILYGLFSNHRYRMQKKNEPHTVFPSGSSENVPAGREAEKNKAPAKAITFAMVDASITDSICSRCV